MAKISPVSAKYIVHSSIEIDGVVDKPDVIGAIFGQTEGLLGADLELRELQRSGRIGRIEVETDTKSGRTKGMIIIPSSLDKVETCIIAASLETIQRIGPCNAKIKVQKIEDVRVSKRTFVIERAKELLKNLMDVMMPDSQELADEVAYSVRVMELVEYGRDRLPAGPAIDESDEIIIVEGRADVLNLLKHGFKNAIAIQGTSLPPSIAELAKQKICTVFVDGDRGGDLIIKELLQVSEIDYITKAPDGKEVEELTKKEIHKCLRARVTPEQFNIDYEKRYGSEAKREEKPVQKPQFQPRQIIEKVERQSYQKPEQEIRKRETMSAEEKKKFLAMLDELVGTRGAFILDNNLNTLGRVPTTELNATLRNLKANVYAIILDGVVDRDLVFAAERLNVKYLIASEIKFKPTSGKVEALGRSELGQ